LISPTAHASCCLALDICEFCVTKALHSEQDLDILPLTDACRAYICVSQQPLSAAQR